MDNIYIRRDARNSTGFPRLVIESKRPDLWGVPLYHIYFTVHFVEKDGDFTVHKLWGLPESAQLTRDQVKALIRREEAFPELHRF